MDSFLSQSSNRLLLSLVLLTLVLALLSSAYLNLERSKYAHGEATDLPATISVSGEGEVLAIPDIGRFSFSVLAESDDVTLAQEESGLKINAIIAYLKEAGIEDKDIKTLNYNLRPKYRYEEQVCPEGVFCERGRRVQDGFEVSQTIEVKVRDTDEAGSILSGVGERGATNISGLSFTIDDEDALKEEARAEAIADAKAKAEVLADQLGVSLVRIVEFNEGGYAPSPYMVRAEAMSMDMAEDEGFGGGPSVPTGEQSTRSNVVLIYEIK
jgi:uncharacterized protein YggE